MELGNELIPFGETMIMFQDEARFGRINETRRCWVQGARPTVPCQIVREYTYAYAAVCPFDGTLDSLSLQRASKVRSVDGFVRFSFR